MKKILYFENFKDFPLGEFPYDEKHSAIGEYHYVKNKGYHGNWYDPIVNHQWRSTGGTWLVTSSADGKERYMEQCRGNGSHGAYASVCPTLVLKNPLYCAYHIEFDLRLFELKEYCGVAFSYITSRNHYGVGFNGSEVCLFKREQDQISIISKAPYVLEDTVTIHVEICISKLVEVFVNKKSILRGTIQTSPGKVALLAKSPCRYGNFSIWTTEEELNIHKEKIKEKELNLLKKREAYPPLSLIKKIALGNFGSGRQLRIARTKEGRVIFLLAQHQKRIARDSFVRMSCLTAFDIEGKVLWQKGEPNPSFDTTVVSCDLPFQIVDFNNDGKLEVIYAMDFVVSICDLLTGVELKKMNTPVVSDDPLLLSYPFHRLNVDMIQVADFSGKGYKSDFILKDRYRNVWAYNEDFSLLWRYNHKNTGHFPYVHDINNDGRDEILIGYDLIDSTGKLLWTLPLDSDHTDEIIYCPLREGDEPKFVLASGNEGVNIVNKKGIIEKHIEIGHAQRISAAHYNKSTQDMTLIATAFWGGDGIITSYDAFGTILSEIEQPCNGNIISPVAYDGEHELCLINSSFDGGLVDAFLDKVVLFPEDGHPTLCCEVFDIDNDGIDEILCWDQREMWIYKSSKYSTGNKYEKYSEVAFSNYRGEYIIKRK